MEDFSIKSRSNGHRLSPQMSALQSPVDGQIVTASCTVPPRGNIIRKVCGFIDFKAAIIPIWCSGLREDTWSSTVHEPQSVKVWDSSAVTIYSSLHEFKGLFPVTTGCQIIAIFFLSNCLITSCIMLHEKETSRCPHLLYLSALHLKMYASFFSLLKSVVSAISILV